VQILPQQVHGLDPLGWSSSWRISKTSKELVMHFTALSTYELRLETPVSRKSAVLSGGWLYHALDAMSRSTFRTAENSFA
jgi:hypothetical protein